MQARKREAGVVVIERRVRPNDRIVARIASLREACRNVIRNVPTQCLRAVPVRGVARVASSAGEAVVVAHVALRASCDLTCRCKLVRTRKRKAGRAMVKFSVRPGGNWVTRRASRGCGREIRGDVIGNVAAQGRRAVPRRLVAAHTIGGGQAVIIVDMALGAGRGSMCSHERKTRRVVVKAGGVRPGNGVVTL